MVANPEHTRHLEFEVMRRAGRLPIVGQRFPEVRRQYQAELSEFDVLGIMRGQATSEDRNSPGFAAS